MGTGSGVYGLNSKIYTNSYAWKSYSTTIPNRGGGSFAGFSRPMYSYQTYHTLANNGPAIGSRALRVDRALGRPSIGFIPPTNAFQI
jgi:hypothetical protein